MIRKIAAGAAAWLLAFAAHAVDGVAAEIGYGEDSTRVLRIATIDRWSRLPGYWELSLAVWDNPVESTADLGITPVFRYERGAFHVEAAIGFHFVQAHISAQRSFSTAFQFGDHIGAGYRSGHWVFGVRLQHLSNGGLRQPNPGINFLLLRLEYDLEKI
jgi:hypothetical protein